MRSIIGWLLALAGIALIIFLAVRSLHVVLSPDILPNILGWASIVLTVVLFIVALAGNAARLASVRRIEQHTIDQIAEAESKVEEHPEKAKPAWDLARVTLEAYFNRNLSQINSIYWLSILVMFAGFTIVIWGIFQATANPQLIAPSVIATLSGVVTEFIGATFLFIYRSTIQQAVGYSATLERINAVGMAMQILDTIPDATQAENIKSKTKATLVELLVRQAYEVSRGTSTK